MISKKEAFEMAATAHIRASLKALEEKIIAAANAGLFEVCVSNLTDAEQKGLAYEGYLITESSKGYVINWQNPSWGSTPIETRREFWKEFLTKLKKSA